MKKLMICIFVLAISLAACGGQSEEAPSLEGASWQWVEYQDNADENNITVSDPQNYTLTLEDGTASIKADCNQVSWPYTLDGNQLTFDTSGPSTLAACGDESLDTVYLNRLGGVATYMLSDGKLFLNLQFDSGNMVFDPQ